MEERSGTDHSTGTGERAFRNTGHFDTGRIKANKGEKVTAERGVSEVTLAKLKNLGAAGEKQSNVLKRSERTVTGSQRKSR